MAVILLRPLECYGDDDSDLRRKRRKSDMVEVVRAVTRAAKPPLVLVTSPTEKAEQKSNGQRHTKVRPGPE
jgi:hypothetical protein